MIAWFGCYYVTLLQTNTSAYPFLFSLKEQNVLEMHPFLKHPTLLCAEASDGAIGKGRGLLWAVSNHKCISTSYSPEETSTHWDVPPRAPQLPLVWSSSHMADTAPAANSATISVSVDRCPAADVLVCKWQPLSWLSTAKFVPFRQKPKCYCTAGTFLTGCWSILCTCTFKKKEKKHGICFHIFCLVFCQKQCWWGKRGNYKV